MTIKKINLAIGEQHLRRQPSPYMSPPQRKIQDCTTLKAKTEGPGVLICLKEYNEKDIHPEDLKVIKRHTLHKTLDGTPYYDFTSERTLEEIKAEKMRILKEGNWKFDKDTIFSPGKRTVHIPDHYETLNLYWDCDGDHWTEEKE